MDRKAEKKEFSPQGTYQWGVDDKFVVTGGEIDIINKALNAQTQDMPDYQRFLFLQAGLQAMANILKESYNSGIIKEVVVPQASAGMEPEVANKLTELKAVPLEQNGQDEQEV